MIWNIIKSPIESIKVDFSNNIYIFTARELYIFSSKYDSSECVRFYINKSKISVLYEQILEVLICSHYDAEENKIHILLRILSYTHNYIEFGYSVSNESNFDCDIYDTLSKKYHFYKNNSSLKSVY